eukprot:4145843-Amphidinium_carterae.1
MQVGCYELAQGLPNPSMHMHPGMQAVVLKATLHLYATMTKVDVPRRNRCPMSLTLPAGSLHDSMTAGQ